MQQGGFGRARTKLGVFLVVASVVILSTSFALRPDPRNAEQLRRAERHRTGR